MLRSFVPLFALALFASNPTWADTSGELRLALQEETDLSTIEVGQTIEFNLRSGGRLKGKVVEITRREFRIDTRFGVQLVERSDVTSFERVLSNTEKFEKKAAECETADDWVELAEWADEVSEPDLRKRALESAIEVDPENVRARELRGEKKTDEGEWVSEEEYYKRKGMEFYRGKWRTKEEVAQLKEKEKSELAAKKLKGKEELEKEYTGRPWAAIEPIVTPHYEIWCNSTLEVAQRYADIMEQLYTAYDRVFPKSYFPRRLPPGGKSNVWIHANHQQFMDWTGVPRGVGGFFRPAPNMRDVTAYHGSFGATGSTEEVLAHEGTHQFQAMIFKNMMFCPTWTIEGMAVYFGDGSEIERGGVEINIIPRDRLLGLQGAIENGTYFPLKRLIRLPHAQFSGFFYGHGWGIFYWCLWGRKTKNWEWSKDVGIEVMNDWVQYCRDIEEFNIEKHARTFEDILTSKTGESIEEWEKKYKEWILSLEVEPIGKRRGSGWVSEKLGVQVGKPKGSWRFEKDSELEASEVVAFKGTGKTRRIATVVAANWQKSDLEVPMAENLFRNFFAGIEYAEGGEPVKTEVFGYPAVRATFKAKRVVPQTGTVGGTGDGDDAPAAEERDTHMFQVVLYATFDKIYANVLETDPSIFEKQVETFEDYLERFKITF